MPLDVATGESVRKYLVSAATTARDHEETATSQAKGNTGRGHEGLAWQSLRSRCKGRSFVKGDDGCTRTVCQLPALLSARLRPGLAHLAVGSRGRP